MGLSLPPISGFSNQGDFEHHLRQQDRGRVTEAQIQDFASIAQSFAADARQNCPVCLGETTSIPSFPAHLAHHLERIAVFSLPREVSDEDTTSLASFRAMPRSMSDRSSISTNLPILSSQGSVAGSHSEHQEQSLLVGDTIQWFRDNGGCDLVPPQQPASPLDAATLHAFHDSPEFTSWYNGSSAQRLVCHAQNKSRKVSQEPQWMNRLTFLNSQKPEIVFIRCISPSQIDS